jgi:MFS transporter, FSR family, fosmidomycin resistance protein
MNNISTTQKSQTVQKTVYSILFSIAFAHFLNDLIQAIIPAVYPILKQNYGLSFSQIGLITFSFQLSASLFQPLVGYYTDKYPKPFSQIFGMIFSLIGVILLSYATAYYQIIIAVICIGIGSSIFHPEASRISYLASGGKRGLAQSIFQIGGNLGTALGPLLVALLVVPNGQHAIIWFVIAAVIALFVISRIAFWYRNHLKYRDQVKKAIPSYHDLPQSKVVMTIIILLIIIFSKYFYSASLSSYYTFYTMDKFGLSIKQAQFHLFLYLMAYAIGTIIGGPLGDKIGRKHVILLSVFGAAPFALLLPYANLFFTDVLMVVIGIIISSAFPAILVYAQELLPKKLGMISGLFYGFAFGMAGIGSAIIGSWADKTSIQSVYQLASFFPLMGIICYFLPNLKKIKNT